MSSRVCSLLRAVVASALLSGVLVARAPGPAEAGFLVPDGFVDEPVVGGLAQPVNLAFLPDGRCLVIERVTARVRVVRGGALSPLDPALTVDSVRTDNGERGLLGIAVDPGWPARPYIYVVHSHLAGPWTRLARFRAVGDVADTADGLLSFDPASRHDLLGQLPDANPVHNGGSAHFGPDGRLYVALGDDNVPCDAQEPSILRGKILRLAVDAIADGPGRDPDLALLTPADNPFVGSASPPARLVYATGLRNPYSFAIDPLDGTLYIADVGAASFEEIDRAPHGGLNFQWPLYEGPMRLTFPCAYVDSSSWVPPVYAYDRTVGQTVIAGVLYRRPPGAAIGFPDDHAGSFFFTDFYTGILRRLVPGFGGSWVEAPAVAGQPGPLNWGQDRRWVSAFATAPDGSVHYTQNWTSYPQPDGQLRRIRRIVTAAVPALQPPGEGIFLDAPSPNPAKGAARFRFVLGRPLRASAAIHDARGRLVRRLVRAVRFPAGPGDVAWDGRDETGRAVPAGIYQFRIEGEGLRAATRLVQLGDPGATGRPARP